MVRKQQIETQYLKFIGVTLLMTAACISDADKRMLFGFDDDQVREIILEQFHNLSSEELEGIEWEKAIQQAAHEPLNFTSSQEKAVFKRLLAEAKINFPTFLLKLGGVVPDDEIIHFVPLDICCDYQCFHLLPFNNRNKHSMVTRAGPYSC